MNNKSKERAKEILKIYLDKAKNLEFIKSIILVGSLSDDTYTGNAGSDIDLIHIVGDDKDYYSEKKDVFELINKVENLTDNDIPISKVVFQQKHLSHPYNYDFELSRENNDLIQRPIEIFRILDGGVTVYGEDLTGTIESPTRDDVKKTWRLNKQFTETLANTNWYKEYTNMRKNPTIRIMTQIVLTAALSDYYFWTNKNCSSKYRILECVKRDLPELEYLNLLRLCHKNRFFPNEITQEDIKIMKQEYADSFLTKRKTWEL